MMGGSLPDSLSKETKLAQGQTGANPQDSEDQILLAVLAWVEILLVLIDLISQLINFGHTTLFVMYQVPTVTERTDTSKSFTITI